MGNTFVVRSRTSDRENSNYYDEDYQSNNNKQRIANNQQTNKHSNKNSNNTTNQSSSTNSNNGNVDAITTRTASIKNNNNTPQSSPTKHVNINNNQQQQSSPSSDTNIHHNSERSSSTITTISQISSSVSSNGNLIIQIDDMYKEIEAWEQVPSEYKIGIHNLYKKIKKRYQSNNSVASPNELSLKKHSIRIGSPLHFYKYFNVQLRAVKEMIYQEYVNDDIPEDVSDDEIPSMEEYFTQTPSHEIVFKKPLKVKLIISDLNQPKLASKMASTVNSFVNVFSQFGWVHTAFSISNLKFDWVKSEYCETGDVKGTSCLLAITVKEISDLNDLENCLKILSEEVSRWNREYSYGSVTNDKKLHSKKIANCQDFTIFMLQKIGVTDLKFENTSIGDYLESVFTKGLIDIVFTTNKEFRDKYNLLFKENNINRIVDKKHTFPTHKDLDLFVHDFFKVDSSFEQTEECQLLKAFDRGFWLKYRKSCQHSQYDDTVRNEPLQSENHEHGNLEVNCPFGDPQDSYSLLVQPNLKR